MLNLKINKKLSFGDKLLNYTFSHYSNSKDKKEVSIFKIISEIAEKKGIDVYLVGGFVRDIILKRYSKDIDIVVIGNGIEFAKEVYNFLQKKYNNNIYFTCYKNFGTSMIKFNDFILEFVGARKESYRNYSRKPIVEEGTLEDDIKRRDFSINAMVISLNKKNFGFLIDPFNGIKDIKNKTIRTPLNPDITYADDPLRMMRAIRFASQLQFNIDENSYSAIIKNKERIKIVSTERISDELNKIISSPKPSVGFKLLEETGLLKIIFPELQALKGIEVINGIAHKDNFYHTLQVLDNVADKSNNLWLRWAAILHDIAKPLTKKFREGRWTFHGHENKGAKMVKQIFRNLKLPLDNKMKYVQKLVFLHLRPIALVKDEVSDSAIRRLLFEAGNDIDDLMLLCEADITSKNEEKVKHYKENLKKVRKKLIELEEKDKIRNFQPPISGNIIMKTFGINPCKEVGIIKNAIKDAILDGIIPNEYNAAYEYMLKIGEKLGLKSNFSQK